MLPPLESQQVSSDVNSGFLFSEEALDSGNYDSDSDLQQEDGDSRVRESDCDCHNGMDTNVGVKSKKGINCALIYGLIPGAVPVELLGLTSVELSMIALINPLSKMRLEGRSHYEATKPTYTIINNVNLIACQLPRKLSDTDFAILRSHQGQVSKDFTFRPSIVMQALFWLKANNHLYKNVMLQPPEDWTTVAGCFNDSEIAIGTIELSAEETALVDEGKDIIDQIDHSAHESSGTSTDLLLVSSYDGSSNMDLLQDALEDHVDDLQSESDPNKDTVTANVSVEKLFTLIVERGGQAEFTDASKEDFFIEMCFPQYFPYGRGGPGDPFSKQSNMSRTARILKFAQLALTSGGHYRKLQNDFRFISLCYFIFMRKRMAGKLIILSIIFIIHFVSFLNAVLLFQ